MNSIASKRPSSARRNIKQESFSPYVSSARLRSIQELLHTGNGDSEDRCDAILCILGIDSRYNDGSRQLVDYLLFNFFDTRRTEIERSGYEEEIIDDMVFLIRRDRVDVYCNPINYLYLLPYVAHWRNLRLHCMTEADYEDDEAAEMFKITSFLAMVDGCKTVGIPYTGTAETSNFDKMSIEKWPIVQAFAHEEIGGGGFFTMRYEVKDVSPELHSLYHVLDPVSLEAIITEQLPLFERQWGTMMTTIKTAGHKNVATLTERGVSESLWSYFNHGRVSSAKIKREGRSKYPFTLFGRHSKRGNLEKAQAGAPVENTAIEDSGNSGAPATHMVCQAVSPRAPLCCTRTYFFSTGVTPHPVSSKAAKPKPEVNEISCLSQVYKACVKAVHVAIGVYAATLSVSKTEEEVLRVLQKESKSWKDSTIAAHINNRTNLEISTEAHDNNNSVVVLHEGHSSYHVKTLRVTVYDVPGPSGQNLGSISFGESFIDSAIRVQKPDGSTLLDAEYCILTRHVPCYVYWPYTGTEAAAVTALTGGQENGSLGEALVSGEPAALLTESCEEVFHTGSLYIYEDGLAFTHPNMGVMVVPKSYLDGIYFYDGDTLSLVALLVLSYHPDLAHFLPHHMRAPPNRLILGFYPRSKAYKALYSRVLPVWKQEDGDGPPLEPVDELPEELLWLQDRVQKEHESAALPPAAGLRAARGRFPRLASLCNHFAASRVMGDHVVPQKDMNPITQQPCDVGGFEDEEFVITVLTGMVGGHKDALCNIITKMCKEDSRWAVIRHQIDHTESFNPAALQANLATLLAKSRSKGGGRRKAMRTVLVTTGLTDTVDVIQAITNHPNRDAAAHLKVGAVTVCLDHTNMFMKDRYTLPKLLDQCAQGWVNNIVFTGPSSDKRLAGVQELIRAVNSDVALLLAEGGQVTRSPDLQLILSETAFSDPNLVLARYLSCPGWRQGVFVSGPPTPHIREVALRFSRPLDKTKLFTRLKGLKGEHKGHPFTGNIYHVRGRVIFKGSEELQEFRYTVLSSHLHVGPVEKAPTTIEGRPAYCVVLTGCSLEEAALRDLLRHCAPQKPEKKVQQTRKSLSRAEVKKIHGQHHLEPLPEGWFYNGSRYVSLGGDKSDMHPSIEEFVAVHLEKINKEVDAYNARIDSEEYPDLFS